MSYGFDFFASIYANGEITECSTCESYPTTFFCAYPRTIQSIVNKPAKVNYNSGVCHYSDNINNAIVILGYWLMLAFAAFLETFLLVRRICYTFCFSRRYLIGKIFKLQTIKKVKHCNLHLIV